MYPFDDNDIKVKRPEYFHQGVLFTGLVYGAIHPMDLDGLMDTKGKGWIFIEYKHGKETMGVGQQIALERLVNDMEKAGKYALLILAEHHDEPLNPIDSANAVVRATYHHGKWHDKAQGYDVRSVVDMFIDHYHIEGMS